jgi:hypothetical protein
MDAKKKYHLLCMQNDQNRVAGVHGNETMNTTILIFRTRL